MRIAVDIGGTFTDGVALETATDAIWVAKTLTTPRDPGEAVSAVIASLLEQIRASRGSDTDPAHVVEDVVHGTTLVTNAILERKGAPTALIVTKGTRDVPDIRRELRYDLYDLGFRLPEPLVPRSHRFEIDERLAADGSVVRELDEAEVEAVLAGVADSGARAVAVCFLHAYANDAHERAVGAALRRARPQLAVSLSSAVAREMREFERMSTTAADAYVKPLVSDYLRQLEDRLARRGVHAPLRVMLSSGGFTSTAAAADNPIALLESGPAAGVLSATNAGLDAGLRDILAFDMGGTTAKACVVHDGEPSTTRLFETGRVHRFKRGSGLPLLIASIDLLEIGAGGGSIAAVSDLGLLKVGPESAGADPGPVCYGRGGRDPTVTDADLCLGYLDAEHFLGGSMRLDKEAAGRSLAELGRRLGMAVDAVAFGIHNIVNESMAGAARVHIAEKGHDPRAFTLVVTGGAGPVHAVEIARKLGIRRVLCGPAAGAGSCLGLLAAPVRVDRSWSRPATLDRIDWADLREALGVLERDAATELRTTGIDAAAVGWELEVEMRYRGQGHTVAVALPYGHLEPGFAPTLTGAFDARYESLFGRHVPHGVVEVVTWRLIGREALRRRRFLPVGRDTIAPTTDATGRRPIYQPLANGFAPALVYDRYRLPVGARLDGPLVIEERESTLVVPVPATVHVRDDLSVLVELEA